MPTKNLTTLVKHPAIGTAWKHPKIGPERTYYIRRIERMEDGMAWVSLETESGQLRWETTLCRFAMEFEEVTA